jgi:anthranilate/para-aminobenzoate synthase component I
MSYGFKSEDLPPGSLWLDSGRKLDSSGHSWPWSGLLSSPVESLEIWTREDWKKGLDTVRADFAQGRGALGQPRWAAYISYEAGSFCEESIGEAADGAAFESLPKAIFWRYSQEAKLQDLAPLVPRVLQAEARAFPDAEEHRRRIDVCRSYIGQGEIYQANLSRRIELDFSDGFCGLELTRRLQERNQHSFSSWLKLGHGFEIVSLTPECLLKGCFGEKGVASFPIKGTAETGSMALCADPKEQAEHVMIVDLVRNDLGRVSDTGSVYVDPLLGTRDMRTLRHLESTVHGQLRDGFDVLDALEALLPGGSITGAPKIRSTEVISELEKRQRGPYTGALMTVDGAGRVVVSLLIRTLVKSGSKAWLDVGGGIVWDSDPHREVDETRRKARAHLDGIVEDIP